MKVREGGWVTGAVVLIATGVNGDQHREVLGMRVATSQTGAAWNEFFADLTARGLAGVRLVDAVEDVGDLVVRANVPDERTADDVVVQVDPVKPFRE